MHIDEKKIHKDTFNFEAYNRDVIKEVDEHNKNLEEKLFNFDTEILNKEAQAVDQRMKKNSVYINWRENQYEEIFGHS